MLASRAHWRILIGTIVVLIAAAWLVPRFVPMPGLRENRVLAHAPPWPHSFGAVRQFRKDADAYVADNFPARRYLIAALNRVRMMAGVSGSKRVIVGRDGWLFYEDDTHLGAAHNAPPMTSGEVRGWLAAVAGRTEAARAAGVSYLVVAPPIKEVLYPQHAPVWFSGASPDRPALALPRLAAEAQAGEVLYLYPQVAAATRAGQPTFSRHDTHWTGYGAYAGYAGLMQRLHALGLTEGPRPLSAFPRIPASVHGGPRDLALMLGVSSFVDLNYPRFGNPAAEAKLHRTFLGPKHDWTAPQVIDTGEVGKPVLLMTRDSFSNELLPFMYSHFSRIILAHNQDGFWRGDLVERFKPDIIILEVVESGLRVMRVDGPAASPAALARIDGVLGAFPRAAPVKPPPARSFPRLTPPSAWLAAEFAGAKATPNCNIESASLMAGAGRAWNLTVTGWISELGPAITSPMGHVRLRGATGDFAAPMSVSGARPDVAAYFHVPTGAHSGFLGTYVVDALPAGVYAPYVYRRTSAGWIVCAGAQALTAP